MVNLEEMMLQEEIGENEGGTDVEEAGDGMERNGDGDVEILRCQRLFFVGQKQLELTELLIRTDRLLDSEITSCSKYVGPPPPNFLPTCRILPYRLHRHTPILQEYFAPIDAACKLQPHLVSVFFMHFAFQSPSSTLYSASYAGGGI